MTLLATGEEERERLRLRSIRINSTSSYRQSKTSQLNLREFIGLRGMNDIAFEDLTEEFGKSYKLFLIGKGIVHPIRTIIFVGCNAWFISLLTEVC